MSNNDIANQIAFQEEEHQLIMRDKSDIADQVIGIVSSVIKSSMENSRVSYYEKQVTIQHPTPKT